LKDVSKLSYREIGRILMEITQFYVKDVIFVGEDEWNESGTKKRRHVMRLMILNTMKRMTGGCFLCDNYYSNIKPLSLCGLEEVGAAPLSMKALHPCHFQFEIPP
jgi:hypothetical protein